MYERFLKFSFIILYVHYIKIISYGMIIFHFNIRNGGNNYISILSFQISDMITISQIINQYKRTLSS